MQVMSEWDTESKGVGKWVETFRKPHLPAGRSCHAQGCAAGQRSDLHEDVYERFVQTQTAVAATPTMQWMPSVEWHHKMKI